ncbi:phosphorylase family protein [Frateuria aurantia]
MNAGGGVGLVVAMRSEARLLWPRPLRPGLSVPVSTTARLQLSGMGQSAAQAAARQLVAEGVAALAVFGVAGGLDPAFPQGSVICASEVCTADGQRFATDADWRAALQAATGGRCQIASLLSSPVALSTPLAKRQAAQRHSAVAVDMESAAVAAVAAEHGLPLLVVRAIADEAGDILPQPLQQAVDALGQPRPWKMLTTLLTHPRIVPLLPGLARRMQRASRALQEVARMAGPDLAWSVRANPSQAR